MFPIAGPLPVFFVVICAAYFTSASSSAPSDPCSDSSINDVERYFDDSIRCLYYIGEVHPSLLDFEYCVYIIPLGSRTPEFLIPPPTDNFTDIFLQTIRPNCERQLPVAFSYYPLPTNWTDYPVPTDVIYRCCPKTGCDQCTAEELKHDMIFKFIEHIETGNSSRTCFNRDHDLVHAYPGVDTCILAMSLSAQKFEGQSRIVNGPMSFNGFAGYEVSLPYTGDSISTASVQLGQEGCASWTAENGTVVEGYLPDGHCLQVLRPSGYEVLCCCYENTDACKFYGRQHVPRKTDRWIRSLPTRQTLAGRSLEGTKLLIDGRVKFHCVHATYKGKDFFDTHRAPRDEILGDVADACLLQMTVSKNGTNGTHGFYMQLRDADIHNDCAPLVTSTGLYRVFFSRPTCRSKLVGNDEEKLVMNHCCSSGDFCNHPFISYPSLSETLNFATPLICDPSDQLEFAAREVIAKGSISSVKVCHVPLDIQARRLSTEFYQYKFTYYPVMWELEVKPSNIACRWYLASSRSGCYRDNTSEVLLPRLLFTCEVPVAEYKVVMRTLDVNAAYEQAKLHYGCSSTHGGFVDYSAYTANCTNNHKCIESMGHSAGCYAILQRTQDGVLQIKAGSVVNSSDVAKLYPKDIDESGKTRKTFSQFRKFVELNSSVVLVCAMANMSACNHYYHRMLYVYHAHVHPTGYNAMDSTLVQSCTGASDGRACLREDNCFLDVDLDDKTNQEGQCYRRSGWTNRINQSSTICDTFNSSDHCYAVQPDTGEVHLLCCCVDGYRRSKRRVRLSDSQITYSRSLFYLNARINSA